jgi:transposase
MPSLFERVARSAGRACQCGAMGLRDEQWDRIKDPYLAVKAMGAGAKDNRLFVEAVLYRFRTGCPWRDPPKHFDFGKRSTNRSIAG